MNESYFQSGLYGEPRCLPDERTRCRWLVADALRELAKGEDKSMAARIRNAAGVIEAGGRPTKKVIGAIGQRRFDKALGIFTKFCVERMKVPNATS